ncbi:hypothetical protein NFI96_010481 [Prochilodus magdalenae]|nr:hypothetical protein NFI96_010481 [Prochilodus magdalenae]
MERSPRGLVGNVVRGAAAAYKHHGAQNTNSGADIISAVELSGAEPSLQSGRLQTATIMEGYALTPSSILKKPRSYGSADPRYRRSSVWVEGEEELNLQQAVVLIEDAINYRSINHRMDQRSILIYRCYFSRIYQWMLRVVIALLLSLALVETPSSLSVTSDLRYKKPPVEPPCGVSEAVEMMCLLVLTLDLFIKQNLRLRRILRPFFLLQNSSLMKKTLKCIKMTLPQIASVVLLLILHLALFTILGMLLFARGEDSEVNAEWENYFRDLPQALTSLLVLLTTTNNPDVMIPAYSTNRLYSLFFILYTGFGTYFLMNLLTAVVYNQFRGYLLVSIKASILRRRMGIRAAFELLSSEVQPQPLSEDKRADLPTEQIYTQSRSTHRADLPTEQIYTQSRSTHRADLHTEQIYTQSRSTHRADLHTEIYTQSRSTHRADLHTEQIYTQSRSTHKADLHTEQIYPQSRSTHKADLLTEQIYTQSRSTHRADLHTEQIYPQSRSTHKADLLTEQIYPQSRSTHKADLLTEQIYTQSRSTHRADLHTEQIYPQSRSTHKADLHTEQIYPQSRSTHRADLHTEQIYPQSRSTHRADLATEQIYTQSRSSHRADLPTEQIYSQSRSTHRADLPTEQIYPQSRSTHRADLHTEIYPQSRSSHRADLATEQIYPQSRSTHRVDLATDEAARVKTVVKVLRRVKMSSYYRQAIIKRALQSYSGFMERETFQSLFEELDKDRAQERPAVPLYSSGFLRTLQRFCSSKSFTVLTNTAALTNVICIFTVLVVDSHKTPSQREGHYTELINCFFVGYYVSELALKVVAAGWRRFLSFWSNIFDSCLTVLLLALQVYTLALMRLPSSSWSSGVKGLLSLWETARLVNMLIVFRFLRVILNIKLMALVASTLLDLVKNLRAFAGILVVVYYVFAVLGVWLFKGAIRAPANVSTSSNPTTVKCGSYEQLGYWSNNFDDFASALVLLYNIMVLNNWQVYLQVYSTSTSEWSKIYFICWWLTSSVMWVNLLVALILENFIYKWDKRGSSSVTDSGGTDLDTPVQRLFR